MNRLTLEQRYQIIQIYFENHSSISATYRGLRDFYGAHKRPSEQAIRRTVDRFRTTYSLHDAIAPTRQRNVRTEGNIAAVNKSVEQDRNLSIRRRSRKLGLCPSTTWKILRKDLCIHPKDPSDEPKEEQTEKDPLLQRMEVESNTLDENQTGTAIEEPTRTRRRRTSLAKINKKSKVTKCSLNDADVDSSAPLLPKKRGNSHSAKK